MQKKQLPYKYFFFDLLASLIVWVLFVVFRKYINNYSLFQDFRVLFPGHDYLTSLLLFPLCCTFVHYLTGFYLNALKHSKVLIFSSTFVSALIISVSVFLSTMLRDVTVSHQYFYASMFVLFVLFFSVTFIVRTIIYSQVRKKFLTNTWTINTLIIGANSHATKIANDLQKFALYNTFVGFVTTNKNNNELVNDVLGNISQIGNIITTHEIKEVIIVLDDKATEQQLFNIVNLLYNFDVEIQFTPRLYEILTGSAKISNLGIIPLVNITRSTMPNWQISVKRFFDFAASAFSLFVLFPFLFYVAIRIKLDSKGPIFYKQERIGRFGKPYKILKFRTMKIDSESGVPKLSNAFDNRITKYGKILRKYRIDEIPQFWNILKGEMSLVGPRPERKYYINEIIKVAPYYCLLYKIRPGLTSWGPIKIGYADTVDKMVERLNYDIIYLEDMSLFNDFKILIYTFEIIVKGKGI